MTKKKIKEVPVPSVKWDKRVVSLVVGMAVMAVGFGLANINAAGFFAAVDPDNGTVSGNATLVSDSSAYGGKAVQFNAPPPTTPPPTTPPPSGSCKFTELPTNDCNPWLPPAASGKTWKLSFTEEFNGSDYDHTKLTPCFDWNTGGCTSTFNNGREHYQPSQVVVNNGTAKLIAAPLSPPYAASACQNGSCTYKAGLLSTARPRADNGSAYLHPFTYGYVESRFKFPATRGFFTAFWMLPTDPTYTYQTEIDILELLGNDPKSMFMTYHYAGRDNSYQVNNGTLNNGACPVKDYSQDFVRMGVDWQPDHIAWYIDGVKCGQFTNASQIEKGPMQLILHMMVDNNWQRSWNVGLTDATLTRQLEVDYIRVFQQQ